MGEKMRQTDWHQQWWRSLLRPLKNNLDLKPDISLGDALRTLGVRDEIHPRDCAPVVRYADMRTARLYARANREAFGAEPIGPREIPGVGIITVLDLRPALASLDYGGSVARWEPTDPALADDYTPHEVNSA